MSNEIPNSVSNLAGQLHRLPGIGPNTARRLAYYFMSRGKHAAQDLATAISNAAANVKNCSVCMNLTDDDPCPICADTSRDHSLICVVEEPLDAWAIERTGEYRGVYHVLHGAISPVEGLLPEDLHINELLERVSKGNVKEILLATNPNLEGETTAMYLLRGLRVFDIRVTQLARGLPMGGDLDYVDPVTLTSALQGRKKV